MATIVAMNVTTTTSGTMSAPPCGYHWVQTGSDYVLVAIATGIIFQILIHLKHDHSQTYTASTR